MLTTSLVRRSAGACALALGIITSAAGAQPLEREASLSVGTMWFDASGTGTAATFAARGMTPIAGRWLLAEGSLGYAALGEQFMRSRTRFGTLEAQLQVQAPFRVVRPYLGLGGGWVRYFTNTSFRNEMPATFSTAAGVRVRMTPNVGMRAEFRIRGWNRYTTGDFGFSSSAAELTGGLSYLF